MPTRTLQHRFAPSTDGSIGMEPGGWEDMSVQARFLVDLEFLTRYAPPWGVACLYCKSPAYLPHLAAQFPWIHFYGYEHAPANQEPEYDPSAPALVSEVPITTETRLNMTVSPLEFTKEDARTMGARSMAAGAQTLLMICHGAGSIRQLALHALVQPSYSLLDVSGVIPFDYLEGELILPMFIPNNKIFVSLVAPQTGRAIQYEPDTFANEIGARAALRARERESRGLTRARPWQPSSRRSSG